MSTAADQVLQVSSVSKTFSRRRGGGLDALVGVSLSLRRGEVLGVVGESGSGKTTLARCIAGLAWLSAGSIEVAGISWGSHPARRDRRSLARHVQLVFQDPYSSLNPRMKVGSLIAEGMIVHKLCQSRNEQRRRTAGLLDQVGLSSQLASAHPRELSGGQRQRVAIARALAVEPSVLLLDEPVSSLDLSIQAQVLNLIRDVIAGGRQAVLFISHDLAVVRFVCDQVMVMQAGRVVERGAVEDVLQRPEHSFTRELLDSVPGEAPFDVVRQ